MYFHQVYQQLIRPHQINFMFLGQMEGWDRRQKVMNIIKICYPGMNKLVWPRNQYKTPSEHWALIKWSYDGSSYQLWSKRSSFSWLLVMGSFCWIYITIRACLVGHVLMVYKLFPNLRNKLSAGPRNIRSNWCGLSSPPTPHPHTHALSN